MPAVLGSAPANTGTAPWDGKVKASNVETRLPELPDADDLDNCASFASVAQ